MIPGTVKVKANVEDNANNYRIYPKSENKTGFPFIVLKPASSAVGNGSFLFAAYTRKNVIFAQSTSPLLP